MVAIAQALTALGALAAIASFYWLNVRVPARRLGIIDLATKQIAFWDQALKLEISATTDAGEQEKAKHRAYAAVQRIRSHADRELERLFWSKKTSNLLVQSKRVVFKMRRPPRYLETSTKVEWYVLKVTCWMFLFIAAVMIVILEISIVTTRPLERNVLKQTFVFAYCLLNIFVATYYGSLAEKLAFPSKPVPPTLDEI